MNILKENYKYVGKSKNVISMGDEPWHCTLFVRDFSTGGMKYCMQQSMYDNGKFVGYSEINACVVTINELEKYFRIVKLDGTLEAIPSKDRKQLDKEIKKKKEEIWKMSKEELDAEFERVIDRLF